MARCEFFSKSYSYPFNIKELRLPLNCILYIPVLNIRKFSKLFLVIFIKKFHNFGVVIVKKTFLFFI